MRASALDMLQSAPLARPSAARNGDTISSGASLRKHFFFKLHHCGSNPTLACPQFRPIQLVEAQCWLGRSQPLFASQICGFLSSISIGQSFGRLKAKSNENDKDEIDRLARMSSTIVGVPTAAQCQRTWRCVLDLLAGRRHPLPSDF